MDARGKTQICISTVAGEDPAAVPTDTSPLLLYLIMVRGGVPGTMLRLAQKSSSLGRSADNTFQIHDSTVSRRHALITVDTSAAAWLMDLGSTNGTFVNGRRIPMHTPVQIGDGSRIQLGSATLLKYLKLDPCEEGFQRELYERSVRDNLTGLYNRGYFLSQIGPLAELNTMCELGLALILVDIDHFKQVNDTHGHHVGDLILREVADVLRESARGEDLVARYGGEEFILALPSCSLEQASELAERIRVRLFEPAGRGLGRAGERDRQPRPVVRTSRPDPRHRRPHHRGRSGALQGQANRSQPPRRPLDERPGTGAQDRIRGRLRPLLNAPPSRPAALSCPAAFRRTGPGTTRSSQTGASGLKSSGSSSYGPI